MSEEKLYIDDGELVYYINENEFIACDEIPMPMLEGIKHLQQKVEQLEKENIKQKEIIENLTTMTVCGDKKQIKNTAQYKLEQLESIRKEAIEWIDGHDYYSGSSDIYYFSDFTPSNDLLNILNKGSEE